MADWGLDPATGTAKGDNYVDGWETGLGVELLFDELTTSAGVLYSKNGATEESLTFLFWGNDSLTFVGGASYAFNDTVDATIALSYANYFPTRSEALSLDYNWWVAAAAAGVNLHF